jgi:hypothetical protein
VSAAVSIHCLFRVFRAALHESAVDFARSTKIRSNFGQSVPTKEKALPRSPRLSAVSRQHKIGQIEVIEEERAFWLLKRLIESQVVANEGENSVPPHPARALTPTYGESIPTKTNQRNMEQLR